MNFSSCSTPCAVLVAVSTRRKEDGRDMPYEVNISLFDAMAGIAQNGPDEHRIARFICAHTIMLALEGVPPSSPLVTGHAQRSRLGEETGRAHSPLTARSGMSPISRRLWLIRTSSPSGSRRLASAGQDSQAQLAFTPMPLSILHFGDAVFAFWRESLDRDQNILLCTMLPISPSRLP